MLSARLNLFNQAGNKLNQSGALEPNEAKS
ncbi:MAG: hypothetical protein ACI9C9_003001 [Marivirga sp.]|jgi:hypothetical protein